MCKQGKSESIEQNQVLDIFTKNYNIWSLVNKYGTSWSGFTKKDNEDLSRIVTKVGSYFKEIDLEEGGK